MYNTPKSQNKKKQWKQYSTHKNETRKAIRSARWNYINKILLIGLNENNTKPFWKYAKTSKQETIGVAPFPKDGELKRDSKGKAEILIDQFKSVFTLDKENDSSSMEGPKYPTIDNLTIHTERIGKL